MTRETLQHFVTKRPIFQERDRGRQSKDSWLSTTIERHQYTNLFKLLETAVEKHDYLVNKELDDVEKNHHPVNKELDDDSTRNLMMM